MPRLSILDRFSLRYKLEERDRERFIEEQLPLHKTVAGLAHFESLIPECKRAEYETFKAATIEAARKDISGWFDTLLGAQAVEEKYGRTTRRFGRDGRDREKQVRVTFKQWDRSE